jgi:acyl carrier protein phosphodiesterase
MPGVFLGDHVKGQLNGSRLPVIEIGIKFHRSVDAHVDQHTVQQRSVRRLPAHLRRYGGIICDVTYDYFLATHWQKFSGQNFESFCSEAYSNILGSERLLTDHARLVIQRMAEHRSLEGYRNQAYIDRSLKFISQRLKFENPLDEAMADIKAIEQELEADFLEFLPAVDQFGHNWIRMEIGSET